jgi:hypothetical protein
MTKLSRTLMLSLSSVVLCCPMATSSLAAQSKLSDAELDKTAKAAGYSKQTVLKGMHNAILWPWVTWSSGISYQFAFNSTANYTVAAEDQSDYNKLPGMGDCGSLDLSRNGVMFGWRWNKTTSKLQISPYANALGVHQTKDSHPDSVTMVEIDMADIQSYAPLRYDIQIDGAHYLFSISGTLPSGRIINAKSKLPRGCDTAENRFKNGSHFYFGGNRVAPTNTSGYMKWIKN